MICSMLLSSRSRLVFSNTHYITILCYLGRFSSASINESQVVSCCWSKLICRFISPPSPRPNARSPGKIAGGFYPHNPSPSATPG